MGNGNRKKKKVQLDFTGSQRQRENCSPWQTIASQNPSAIPNKPKKKEHEYFRAPARPTEIVPKITNRIRQKKRNRKLAMSGKKRIPSKGKNRGKKLGTTLMKLQK